MLAFTDRERAEVVYSYREGQLKSQSFDRQIHATSPLHSNASVDTVRHVTGR